MSDIFISYADSDRPRIRPLVVALQQCGWTVWWDRTILAGKIWEREIEAALAASRCVIVAWSEASVQSKWVWAEADEGDQRGVLLPVLLDQVKTPMAFRKLQAANLVGWRGEMPNTEFEELAKAVTALLGSSAAPAAAETGTTQIADPGKATPTNPHARAKPGPASTVNAESSLPPGDKATNAAPLPTENDPGIGSSDWAFAFGAKLRRFVLGALPDASTAPAPQTPVPAGVKVKVNPKDNLPYVWISPGEFMMGCSPGDSECFDDEKPAHEVSITRGFWMGQTEVTQAAYKAVTGKNPSHFQGDDLPVDSVTWEEAKSYCDIVGMRLPTEAEWEYAARAGTTASRYGNLYEVAWYSVSSEGETHPVALGSPNAWGLYDMLGNVWEWCSDWYGKYGDGGQDNPAGPASGEKKILRGGCWNDNSRFVRVSDRNWLEPSERSNLIGLRCAGELP